MLLFTVLSVACNGYVFAVADHGIHLVFVDRLLSPDRWTGDLLDAAANHHPSVLWWIQAGAGHLLGLPAAFAALHCLTLAATGLGIDLLVRSLGGSPRAALAALLLLAPAQFALGGVPTLDPLLLPRTAALPIELAALVLLARQRPRAAFATLGAAACIHAPSAAGLAVSSCLVLWLTPGVRFSERLTAPAFFFAGVLPVLALWAGTGSPAAALLAVDSDWLAIIDARLAHHVVPSSWPLSEWAWMGAWMAAGHVAFHRSSLRTRHAPFVLGTVAGLALWAVVAGTLLARGPHLALALQLEPWECCRLLTVVLGCLIGLRLGELLEGRARGPSSVAILGVAGGALLLSSLSVGAERRWLPLGPDGPERDLAEWAADHLPGDARIAWPPQAFHEQRWRAQRPGTATWKDGGEALFDRGIAERWLVGTRRLCACDPLGALETDDGRTSARLARLRRILAEGWSGRSPAEQIAAAASLGASHVVLEAQGREAPPTSAEPLYENGSWSLVPTVRAP